MHWVTVYSAADGFSLGTLIWEALGAAVVLVAVAAIAHRIMEGGNEGRSILSRSSGELTFLFAIVFITIAGFVFINIVPRYFAGQRLASGEAKQVQGIVSNFSPMAEGCHGPQESFDVGTQHFEYADCRITGGFNSSCTDGGPICGGEMVKLEFVPGVDGNVILKAQIAERSQAGVGPPNGR
jgi:hypothetical protein